MSRPWHCEARLTAGAVQEAHGAAPALPAGRHEADGWGSERGHGAVAPRSPPHRRRALAERSEITTMDPRTNRFLAGANLAAHGLFQEIAPALDARVLRVAIP